MYNSSQKTITGRGFGSSGKKAKQSIDRFSCDLRIIDLERNIKREPFNSVILNRLVEVRLRLKKLRIPNKRKIANRRFEYLA